MRSHAFGACERWAGGSPTWDGKPNSTRKYARVQLKNASSPNYAKPVTKLLNHDFYVLPKQTRIESAFSKLFEMLLMTEKSGMHERPIYAISARDDTIRHS